jgi:hypothetical protein
VALGQVFTAYFDFPCQFEFHRLLHIHHHHLSSGAGRYNRANTGRSTKWTVSLTHSLTHGAEPFLRSRQLCSYSTTSQHFMEPAGSLPCSQEPSNDPYPEPDQFNPYHPILFL